MEEQVLVHISKLFPLLHSTFQSIHFTFKTLDVNCYEHQNVLKRWILPVKEESYECTCQPSFDEPEEMVNDIECAVQKAKATRKVVMQVKDKQFSRNNGVISSLESLEKMSFKEIPKGKVCESRNRKMEKDQVKSVGNINRVGEKDKPSHHVMQSQPKLHSHHVMQSQPKLSTNVKINKANTFQTTYQKDFSSRNSHRTSQTIKKGVKHAVKQNATTVGIKVENAVNVVDVDSLLEKVSTGVIPKCSDVKINFFQTVVGNNCFLHGGSSPPIVHRSVNLNEAMNLCGIPPELVKLLKTFHQYINIADKLHLRGKCGKESFLHKLNESNRCSWHHAVSEPVIKLCLHYLLVFADTLPQKKTELNGIRLKELEEELNLLIRSYKILDANTHLSDDVLPLKKSEIITSENSAGKGHWALTGIWNRKCWNMFAGFKNMLKISYNGKEECMSLHKKIQDIQNLQLQIEILKFLKNVFPVLSDLQNDNVALVNLYKSCFALCNISCVPVPVLLKT